MITFTFLSTSLLTILLPGSGVIYTVSTGLTTGRRKSFVAAIGCTLGILPHLTLGVLGMFVFTFLDSSTTNILKVLGSLYLIYVGVNMLISENKLQLTSHTAEMKDYRIIMQAILINLLNPKLTLFFLSFLPQFLTADGTNPLQQSLILGLIFMLLTFLVFVIYGQLAGIFNSFVTHNPHRMTTIQRVFGLLFIAFALKLLLVT